MEATHPSGIEWEKGCASWSVKRKKIPMSEKTIIAIANVFQSISSSALTPTMQDPVSSGPVSGESRWVPFEDPYHKTSQGTTVTIKLR